MALENTFIKKDPNPQKLYTPENITPPLVSSTLPTIEIVESAWKEAKEYLKDAWTWIKENPPIRWRSFYKNTIKGSPFYKEAYFSQVNVSGSIYSHKNNASFFKQVYLMWASYNPAPHPGFVNPNIRELPHDSGWDKNAWKNRAEQFKNEAKNFFNAEKWKNIGIDMGVNFSAELLASSLTYGGYDVNKKRKSNFITTDPYPINNETGDFLYNSKSKEHLDLLRPKINHLKRSSRTSEPSAFDNIYKIELKRISKKSSGSSWLISKDTNVLRPAKFNYDTQIKSTHPMNLLHARGADLLSHKFTMYITFISGLKNKKYQEEIEDKNFTDFQSKILTNPGFSVRIGSISIPSIIKETFDIDYLGTKVTKNRSSIIMNNQATVSFRLDQNLVWLNYFDNMAGHNNTIDSVSFSGSTKSTDNRFKNIFYKNGNRDWRTTINYIANSWDFKKINKEGENPIQIMITCKVTDFNYRLTTQVDNLPYIIFDDVKFLGTNSPINYEREGSSPQSISLDFIYKKVYEIYPVINFEGKPAKTIEEANKPIELKITPEWQFLQLEQYKEEVEKQEAEAMNKYIEDIKKGKVKMFNTYQPIEYQKDETIQNIIKENEKPGNIFRDQTEKAKQSIIQEIEKIQKKEPPKIPPFFISIGGKKW